MAKSKGALFITGANGGLGTAIVEELQSNPLTPDITDSTQFAALANLPPHPHDLVDLDLTNLASVRHVASTINSRVAAGQVPPISLLILNAGFQDFGRQAWTEDGFDQIFSANYLGHWLLTLLLLQSIDKSSGRILIIGSQAHDTKDPRNDKAQAFTSDSYKTFVETKESIDPIAKGNWSSAEEDPSWKSGFRRYGASKLFLVMIIHELQRRLDGDSALNRVAVLGVDPGTMGTGLQRLAPWFIRVLMFRVIYPVVTWLSPDGPVEGKALKNAYYFDGKHLDTSAEAKDAQKRDWVWQKSIEYTHFNQEETILKDWK
ncbi:putative short-chain dehydrogenase [Xylariaceae sp. FL0255]|nr:putative short-chain dehydrogenase [Xylariaceae sp. FL0255]